MVKSTGLFHFCIIPGISGTSGISVHSTELAILLVINLFGPFSSKFFTKIPSFLVIHEYLLFMSTHCSWVCVFHFHGIMHVMYIHVTEFKPYHVTCIVMVVTI